VKIERLILGKAYRVRALLTFSCSTSTTFQNYTIKRLRISTAFVEPSSLSIQDKHVLPDASRKRGRKKKVEMCRPSSIPQERYSKNACGPAQL
jgi:hypothetical protein